MKVKECEMVFRYHIYFNREESDFLRAHSWVHPLSAPETDMWFTEADLAILMHQFPQLRTSILAALEQAKELSKKARDEWRTVMDNTL